MSGGGVKWSKTHDRVIKLAKFAKISLRRNEIAAFADLWMNFDCSVHEKTSNQCLFHGDEFYSLFPCVTISVCDDFRL